MIIYLDHTSISCTCKELFTEPGNDTSVLSMAHNAENSNIVKIGENRKIQVSPKLKMMGMLYS